MAMVNRKQLRPSTGRTSNASSTEHIGLKGKSLT